MRTGPYALAKRTFDIAASSIGLIVTAPMQAAVAVVLARSLGRPILFRQVRPGLAGKPFELIKFRTMHPVDASRGLITDEERLPRTGSIVRSMSLDELPTLWNVLRGDMSLVGPRPLLTEYMALYSARQARRHDMRPGITGLAQSAGRNSLSWPEKLELDVQYIESASFSLDLRILLSTFRSVFKREGISAPGHATMYRFTGDSGGTLGNND